jgi:mRNA interferase RelE/StbE
MNLVLAKTAYKDLKKLNPVTQKQIVKKLKYFTEQSDPLSFATKLTNFTKGGNYRFRIGSYRIIFDTDKTTIYILAIEHRREVYRK